MSGFKAREDGEGNVIVNKDYYEELVEASNTLDALHAACFPGFEDMVYQATSDEENK